MKINTYLGFNNAGAAIGCITACAAAIKLVKLGKRHHRKEEEFDIPEKEIEPDEDEE